MTHVCFKPSQGYCWCLAMGKSSARIKWCSSVKEAWDQHHLKRKPHFLTIKWGTFSQFPPQLLLRSLYGERWQTFIYQQLNLESVIELNRKLQPSGTKERDTPFCTGHPIQIVCTCMVCTSMWVRNQPMGMRTESLVLHWVSEQHVFHLAI